MEVEVLQSKPSASGKFRRGDSAEHDRVRVKRKTLQTVLEQCQRALELLNTTSGVDDDDIDCVGGANVDEEQRGESSGSLPGDREADELCDLLKSKVECPDFLEKLESAQASVPQNVSEDGSSWDMVNENDLWEGEGIDSEQEDYVLVRQEDIVEGIAGFMAAYILSLKQTKDLTPNQLQDALSKTFSVKKKKGKLRKAWDGSKVIYNVASWGATAIGIYQNPVILRVATKAFWTSCHVISKIL
ncbi:uncharacterized protein LOC121260743 isoform X2 [Juglans microcarpa x Juglans regia]|uniref:uncharacterized protein LOC121260743 isoform X2 n=1 Tax=Juglans microcarpa x Juglans regia TaxID=2249226 RepID=UPI001B7E56F8|nr:uncharacterized protein LOC121260743 isoform X2 [Juglans microcarpa x Juglans regia]